MGCVAEVEIPPDLIRILQQRGFRLRFSDEADDDGIARRRRSGRADLVSPSQPATPSEEGQKLIYDGSFGQHQRRSNTLRRQKRTLTDRLAYRELGIGRLDPLRSPSNVTVVGENEGHRCEQVLTLSGNDTLIQTRQNHTLFLKMLFWSILGRWELFLFLRSRFQGQTLRYLQSLRLEILQDCILPSWSMDDNRCVIKPRQPLSRVHLDQK